MPDSYYKSVFENIGDGVLVHDVETGEILDANQQYCDLLGYPPDEMTDLYVDDLVVEDWEWPATPTELVEAAREDGSVSTEWHLKRESGERFWAEVTVSLIETDTDELALASVRDVTERKEQQQARKRFEKLYRTLVEYLPAAGIVILDSDYRVTAGLGQGLPGTPVSDPSSLIGMHVEEFVPEAHYETVMPIYASAFEGEQSTFEAPYEDQWVRIYVAPIEEGEEILVLAVDITEQKEQEAALAEKTEQLEVLNRIVSHDIRNDVMVVQGWSEQLRDHVSAEDEAALQRVIDANDHIRELTQTASTFVEAITGDRDVAVEPTRVKPILTEEIEKKRTAFEDATFALDGSIPDAVASANEMLASVFGNLLTNAARHNDTPEPTVEISVTEGPETVTVSIADDGPGISDDQKDTIFGRGEKGLESSGTGIGLYLVDSLVTEFDGRVWVTDNEPTGAVFHVELPLAD
ncbi:PAS domain-containing sensor histidine kinase [Haloarculaceae archaeon H-GB11]|nr:PAS domain-containing sensor histidine kinase [Haloarculaceae archaeon H-GB11]